MRRGICNHLLTIIVSVCGLGAVVSAQGDVNTPWDPAEHFEPYWESVELSARLNNPVERPDNDPNTQRRLSISSGVRILDRTGLVGVETRARDIVAVDQDGTEVYGAVVDLPGSRWYRSIERARGLVGPGQWADEFGFSLSIPMDPNRGYPVSLRRIEWTTGTLVADTFDVVDVPFEPNETWLEVAPGLEILVEEASVEEERYQYRIQAIYNRDVVSYTTGSSWHFWSDEVPPATILLKMEMLNAAGQPVHDVSSSGGSSRRTTARESEGLMTATSTGSGSCSACGDVTTIRYTFALKPYEQEARFVLEDIPVPEF
ncbi:MAG: hypothetical protein ACYTAS_23925 [Planctomycetota bacterium]